MTCRGLCLFVIYAVNKVSLIKTTFVTYFVVALFIINYLRKPGQASADLCGVIDVLVPTLPATTSLVTARSLNLVRFEQRFSCFCLSDIHYPCLHTLLCCVSFIIRIVEILQSCLEDAPFCLC